MNEKLAKGEIYNDEIDLPNDPTEFPDVHPDHTDKSVLVNAFCEENGFKTRAYYWFKEHRWIFEVNPPYVMEWKWLNII